MIQLCKIDSEGKARKVVGCSCVVVKVRIVIHRSIFMMFHCNGLSSDLVLHWPVCFQDFGEESDGLNVVQQHIKSH